MTQDKMQRVDFMRQRFREESRFDEQKIPCSPVWRIPFVGRVLSIVEMILTPEFRCLPSASLQPPGSNENRFAAPLPAPRPQPVTDYPAFSSSTMKAASSTPSHIS